MPAVYPFAAVQFQHGAGDVTSVVAPPYDVLDAAAKAALLQKDPRNVVGIDLPHTPAKELGPPAAYEGAGASYRKMLGDGTLSRRSAPAIFAYRQIFRTGPSTFQRTGMACDVEMVPFGPRPGGGILPHEETFSGPKEDRLALMRATRAQLSPIFGLHADEAGKATALIRTVMESRPADMSATTADGVKHEVWTIDDAATIKSYEQALAGEDIFIADGHHRYNTGLNYLSGLEAKGAVPASHPARRCMMVLVGMSDPGLVIWPTHRVLGGMKDYSLKALMDASRGLFRDVPGSPSIQAVEAELKRAGKQGNVLGLYDFATKRCFIVATEQPDPLASRFPDKPAEWRRLDVAIVQHLLVEQVCQPKLNGGQPVKWAFPHTIDEVLAIGSGAETGAGGGKAFTPQVAVIVRPTPLGAVKAVSRAGQLMPQKSTFFYPKLATGLFINPLE